MNHFFPMKRDHLFLPLYDTITSNARRAIQQTRGLVDGARDTRSAQREGATERGTVRRERQSASERASEGGRFRPERRAGGRRKEEVQAAAGGGLDYASLPYATQGGTVGPDFTTRTHTHSLAQSPLGEREEGRGGRGVEWPRDGSPRPAFPYPPPLRPTPSSSPALPTSLAPLLSLPLFPSPYLTPFPTSHPLLPPSPLPPPYAPHSSTRHRRPLASPGDSLQWASCLSHALILTGNLGFGITGFGRRAHRVTAAVPIKWRR